MFKISTLILFSVFLTPYFFFGQHTDIINSNRPGESMSAFSVGKSVFQVEAGVYGIKEKHNLSNYDAQGLGADLTLRWGLFREQLEFIGDLQYQAEDFVTPSQHFKKNDFRQTTLGAKYLIYDPFKKYEKKINLYSWKANHRFNWRQFLPVFSVFAGANFVFPENPYAFTNKLSVSPKIMLITQNYSDDGKWVFIINIIADYITTSYPGFGYVVAITRGFSDKWSSFIENQGYISNFYNDSVFRAGAACLLGKNFQVDASVSSNFKDTPSVFYGGVGFSWRYDANYRIPEMKSKKIKTGKKSGGIKQRR